MMEVSDESEDTEKILRGGDKGQRGGVNRHTNFAYC